VAQDFAKRKADTGGRKGAAGKSQARRRQAGDNPPRGRSLRLYFSGVLTGVFLSFLGYLSTLSKPADTVPEGEAAAPAAVEVPKPRFDFYTTLPAQKIDVEEKPDAVEPAADVSKPPPPAASPELYFLQAGSFRQQADAERRRAELLLLGLDPKVEGTNTDSGRWFRVYLGPFETHEAVGRARSLLANQNIDAVLLKRGRP
jgi:cell division protein FtsN